MGPRQALPRTRGRSTRPVAGVSSVSNAILKGRFDCGGLTSLASAPDMSSSLAYWLGET